MKNMGKQKLFIAAGVLLFIVSGCGKKVEENQIDMVGSEQVLRFCRSVEEAQDDKLTIIAVTSSGGFIKYDLLTAEGAVNVTRGYYQYSNGILKNLSTVSYPVNNIIRHCLMKTLHLIYSVLNMRN